MLDIIQNNPYRLLGIYSNSPTREKVANHNRLQAFLNVGREVSFPLDLPTLIPAITRNAEAVSDADAQLTLPNEQLRYAQFWFMKATPVDDIAMNHLIAGNVDEAISMWERRENASSIQNRIVCALIQDDYAKVFICAEKLYSSYKEEFVNIVLGGYNTVDVGNLEYHFLDELCKTVGARNILSYLSNTDWKQYVSSKTITPLIDTLQSAVNAAKSSKGQGITARYNAGVKLMNDTQTTLAQLRTLLPVTDLRYQMIADKLGLEILQCGIDYYNGSNAADAARKAMRLQSYALSVVVGQMAKDRCRENVDILQNIINNLPLEEVFAEDRAINEELRRFCQLPDKISYAVTLLNNTKPHLQSIKAKLGANNPFYLKLSTQVVGNALHNVIEEVNAAQQGNGYGPHIDSLVYYQVKSALKAAWDATKIMDTFDMDADFKRNRYNQNRSILIGLCEQLEVFTTTYVPRPTTYTPTNTSTITHTPSTHSKNCLFEKKSSHWQAALILHIAVCIIGYFIAGSYYHFEESIFYGSIIVGAVSWIFIAVDKGDAEEYIESLTSFGCLGIIALLPLVVAYWVYKVIRCLLDEIKS